MWQDCEGDVYLDELPEMCGDISRAVKNSRCGEISRKYGISLFNGSSDNYNFCILHIHMQVYACIYS